MRARPILSVLFFSVWYANAAVDRIAEPVSPSLWDAFLPEPVHPSYASDLGALQEGRLGFGVQDADLAHFSLSVPGLQIISANTKWNVDESARLAYDPGRTGLAMDSLGNLPARQRDLFQVSGGLRLSNFLPSLRNWDAGVGASFTNLAVTDGDEHKIWSSTYLGGSATLQYKQFSVSGAWQPDEQRYRVGYRKPQDVQGGLEVYQNTTEDRAYGVQFGAEKIFRESIKFRSGLRWQWAQTERIENMMLVGTSIRFRPWRAGVDPDWLQPLVAPMSGIPVIQRFLYDWEVSLDMMLDNQYSGTNGVMTLTRWF
jgi:hypothetical protein